jgi:hypothetical protein
MPDRDAIQFDEYRADALVSLAAQDLDALVENCGGFVFGDQCPWGAPRDRRQVHRNGFPGRQKCRC